jgi:hypothetical protein
MNTNFEFPSNDELFSVIVPPTNFVDQNKNSNKAFLIIGCIILIGGCAAIAIYQYRLRQQTLVDLEAERKKRSHHL